MKKITLLITYLFTIGLAQAQCSQPASNFGNNTVPNYDVTGDIDVVFNANNTVSVNLGNNFSTAAGPDVRIFLVDRGTFTDSQLTVPNNFLNSPRIEIGLVSSFTGASSYTAALPNNVSIADYQTVFFYCLQFNQFWDFGSFTTIDSSNCILSNESVDKTEFSIAPNPAVNDLTIQSNSATAIHSVSIYNILGKEVYSKTGNIEDRISIQELQDGAYFVRITDEENSMSTIKLLKKS